MLQAIVIAVGAALIFLAGSCGKDDDKKPDPVKKQVRIGTPELPEHSYSWSPVTGLDNPNAAQPLASPDKTTMYTLTAKTKCGVATSKVTVRVFKLNEFGELIEVL